jgi:hypothetical protein
LQQDRSRQTDFARQLAGDLCWSYDRAFFGGERFERFRKLGVAVVLLRVGGGDKLLGGRELSGELCAVAAIGAPGIEKSKGQGGDKDQLDNPDPIS